MIAASGRLDLPFTCTDSADVPTAPTGTPTGTLVKNGTDLGTTVTVTMTGAQGIASCTIPSDALTGDRFYLRVSAVISGVTYVLAGSAETVSNSVAQTGDNYARIGVAGAGLTAITTAIPTTAQIRVEMDTNSTGLAKLGTPAVSISADIAAVKGDTASLLSRVTSTLFSGVTSLGKWLGLIAGKSVDPTTLAEVNATTGGAAYNNTTDSLEALRDQGDAAWVTGSGGGLTGANLVEITVTDGVNPVPGAIVKAKAGAAFDIKRTDANGVVVFSLDDNTYSVRITAERLSFTPVYLAVTADATITYEMTEVIVDTTAWADGSDLVAYHDALTIGQMLKDDRTAVDVANVPTHPIVGRLLSLATGEVNSALSVSKRYNADDLAAMPDSSLETLRWLTCSIAMWHLRQRRVTTDPDKQARERKILDDYLDRIRRGELVLDVDANKEAGIGEAVPFEQVDTQRGTPLLRDRMSGTAGAFPKRRFPQR